MAVASSSSSSSSSSSLPTDVFLNFRGEDTRRSFVCHLHTALERQAMKAYIDSEDLRKGNELSDLLKAITDSKISIVVFSENYASSTWCLKELVQILKCKAEQKQIVMPVFYQVDPSHVRKQEESFAQAFAKHERDRNNNLQEVQSWKSALIEATNISGWDSRNYTDDAKLIDDIVDHVFKEWMQMSSSKNNNLVGMDSHLHKMRQLLRLEMDDDDDDVVKVGIWGMGGIGKTTIAEIVYDEIRCQFDHYCILPNVKEGFGNQVRMQEQLLSRILKKEVRIDTLNDGYKIMESLSKKKVLLVLDDVDNSDQIETLLGPEPSFGGGSRIIVTTRNSGILNGFEIYEAKLLSDGDAGKLFSQYAFKGNKPSGEYDHLSRRAVEYAQGLPLALKVLGAFLHNRSASDWEDELEKLKIFPNSRIQSVLRRSFDDLDDSQKNIFLDIACFFRGMDRDYVTKVIDSCGFFPRIGLKVLVDRALVTISNFDTLDMHDLLQEMGREIESTKEPGRQSRFWSSEDVERVLTQNTASEAVEGLMDDLPKSEDIYLNAEAFVRMTKLRLLIFTCRNWSYPKYHVNGDLHRLSHELRVLNWDRCPLKSLPSNFYPKNLIHLEICHSHLEQLWEGIKPVKKLIIINLRYCEYLNTIPDLTEAKNIEELDLEGCISLREVHPSIAGLTNLVFLSLKGCIKLKTFPSSIHHLKSLKFLDLRGCSHLEMFPEILEDMEALSELKLDGTAIKELPLSIERLRKLESLSMKNCTSLVCLPSSICNLAYLTYLNLRECWKLDKFPEISETMEALKELNLDETAIEELSSSIERLQKLESLSMRNCRHLVCLPDSVCNLANLTFLNLSGCFKLDKFPESSETMEALKKLNLDETAIEELPSSIERFRKLESLSMKNCTRLVCLPDSVSNLANLTFLYLSECSQLDKLPENLGNLESLRELEVQQSGIKQLPVSILRLNLRRLSFYDCYQMEAPLSSWPASIEARCTAAVHIDFSACNLLELSDAIAYFPSLKILKLSRNNLESLPAIMDRLVCLEQLELEGCKRLKSIPELSSSISYINADDCTALETVSTPKRPYDMRRCFTFVNCRQLVQNDLFRDIVKTHSPPQGNHSRPFYMCFPGSEIPELFIHQCRGSSVTAQLPPNWFDNKFLGFAICAVTNKLAVDYVKLCVRCFCTFKGDRCEYRFSFYLFHRDFDEFDFRWLESNHMFLGYVPWSEFGINGEEVNERCYSEAKFEIKLFHYEGSPTFADLRQRSHPSVERCDPIIERCGVQFFFANNEEVAHQPMVHSEERSWAEPSGSDISDEEQYRKLSELFSGDNRNSREYYENEDTSDENDDELTEDTSDESDYEIEDIDSSGKRKILWTQEVRVTSGLLQGHLDDGFNWNRGWDNPTTGNLRFEHTCTHQPSCNAMSKLRIAIDDPTIFVITYIGRHTCWKTQPMLKHQVRVTPGRRLEGPFDGFSWEKYGQMDSNGAQYPRVYYVCMPQNVQGCMAIKEVQLSDDDPTILKITYRGRHTCIQASTISIGKRGDSRISEGGGALRIHDQVVQSPRSQDDRVVDDNNVNMLPDANSQAMEHFQNVNDNDMTFFGVASGGTSDAVVNQLEAEDPIDFKSLNKRKREMDSDDDQPNESYSISNNNP